MTRRNDDDDDDDRPARNSGRNQGGRGRGRINKQEILGEFSEQIFAIMGRRFGSGEAARHLNDLIKRLFGDKSDSALDTILLVTSLLPVTSLTRPLARALVPHATAGNLSAEAFEGVVRGMIERMRLLRERDRLQLAAMEDGEQKKYWNTAITKITSEDLVEKDTKKMSDDKKHTPDAKSAAPAPSAKGRGFADAFGALMTSKVEPGQRAELRKRYNELMSSLGEGDAATIADAATADITQHDLVGIFEIDNPQARLHAFLALLKGKVPPMTFSDVMRRVVEGRSVGGFNPLSPESRDKMSKELKDTAAKARKNTAHYERLLAGEEEPQPAEKQAHTFRSFLLSVGRALWETFKGIFIAPKPKSLTATSQSEQVEPVAAGLPRPAIDPDHDVAH